MVHAAPHAYHGIIPTLSDASEAHLSKLQAQLAWQLGLLVHKLSASVRLLMHVDEVSRSWPRARLNWLTMGAWACKLSR